MLTAAQAWTLEGEKRGLIRGKIEMVENFLKAGVACDVVVNATGITQEKLQELKATLQEMMATQSQPEPSRPLLTS